MTRYGQYYMVGIYAKGGHTVKCIDCPDAKLINDRRGDPVVICPLSGEYLDQSNAEQIEACPEIIGYARDRRNIRRVLGYEQGGAR